LAPPLSWRPPLRKAPGWGQMSPRLLPPLPPSSRPLPWPACRQPPCPPPPSSWPPPWLSCPQPPCPLWLSSLPPHRPQQGWNRLTHRRQTTTAAAFAEARPRQMILHHHQGRHVPVCPCRGPEQGRNRQRGHLPGRLPRRNHGRLSGHHFLGCRYGRLPGRRPGRDHPRCRPGHRPQG
jgi:hypothetical protein